MMKTWRILRALAFLTLLGIAGLIASLRIDHGIATALPIPTGSFHVGRAIYDWKDDATLDPLAPPRMKREVLVWIWYPAAGQPGPGEYLPEILRLQFERTRGTLITKFLTRDLSKVQGHSVRDVAVSEKQNSYPVVILRGGASAEVVNYSTLAEDLASNGYVVVGIDAPYRTNVVAFPDGRVMRRSEQNNPELDHGHQLIGKLLTAWISDIRFVLDRLEQLNVADPSSKFTGRLDLAHVGVFGHSFGGAQALQFCHDDARCKAAIDIDGAPFGSVVRDSLKQPFLLLLSAQVHSTDPESRAVISDLQSIYDHAPAAARLRVSIRGSNHFLFNDDAALLKSHILMKTLRTFGLIGIDGDRQLDVTRYCIRSFFDSSLKGIGSARAKMTSSPYSEIEVLE